MTEVYCHGQTLRNAPRAVWIAAGKALFSQAAARYKTLVTCMQLAAMPRLSAGGRGALGSVVATR